MSCVLWQRDICSKETSNCLEYDQANFRYYVFAGGIATKLGSFVFILLAYKTYKLPQKSPVSVVGGVVNKAAVEPVSVVGGVVNKAAVEPVTLVAVDGVVNKAVEVHAEEKNGSIPLGT